MLDTDKTLTAMRYNIFLRWYKIPFPNITPGSLTSSSPRYAAIPLLPTGTMSAPSSPRQSSDSKEKSNEAVSFVPCLPDDDNPYFIRDLVYTKEEEAKVIRTLDLRLFPWILLTTFVLNMDRTNNSNAISDNLPADLGFTIDVVNTATAIYSVFFSIFTRTGAVIAKIAGPSRCQSLPLHN